MPIRHHILILVENLPVPFDRRVWQEAQALCEAGYEVSVICPRGKGYDKAYEVMGVFIYIVIGYGRRTPRLATCKSISPLFAIRFTFHFG